MLVKENILFGLNFFKYDGKIVEYFVINIFDNKMIELEKIRFDNILKSEIVVDFLKDF